MTDYTIVGRDANGAELRINDRVRVTHPGAQDKWRNHEAAITAKHSPHFAESLASPCAQGEWARLDSGCVTPVAALEKVA